jgi:hypothetical protein
MLAYGFLLLERLREEQEGKHPARTTPGKKGVKGQC